jgi:Zn-dependent M28 family amino/carboxypeptidase
MYFRGKKKYQLVLLLFLYAVLGLTACNGNTLNSQTSNVEEPITQNGSEISVTEGIVEPDPTEVLEETKEGMVEVVAEEKTFDLNLFGQEAYSYIEYFQNNLSARIAATQAERKAADYLVSELKNAGYVDSQIEIQSFKSSKNTSPANSQNVIVTKKGASDKIIVVGAHYDCVETHGVEDNTSGVSVVLENAIRLVDVQLPYTTKFIFFGAEEVGLIGSGNYVNSLTKEEMENMGLMINLDCIMTGDKAYLFGGAVEGDGTIVDTWAVEKANAMADELGLETYLKPDRDTFKNPSPVAGNGSDHANFKNHGIAYVYFTSANFDLPPYDGSMTNKVLATIMHTPNDDLDILNEAFGEHMQEMLKIYSILLHHMLLNNELIE